MNGWLERIWIGAWLVFALCLVMIVVTAPDKKKSNVKRIRYIETGGCMGNIERKIEEGIVLQSEIRTDLIKQEWWLICLYNEQKFWLPAGHFTKANDGVFEYRY